MTCLLVFQTESTRQARSYRYISDEYEESIQIDKMVSMMVCFSTSAQAV
ncbi:hypothetical protein HMPREF3202_00563 [Prevotella bivia]|uniref:Uncharacterized protein n=1 Tax=Prevotella bivia TaxID=28125 RepID=A0A137SZZ7_9BACT|nr:hypothetical protein HMPREF3202_00563 [Prevotella bivia]